MDYQMLIEQQKEKLMQKWEPFLEGIEDDYTAKNTAVLLENEARYLTEAPNKTSVSDVVGLQKIMLPIVRRVFPNLIANNIVSVQPIVAPAGIIFYLKYVFGTAKPGTAQGDEYSMLEAANNVGGVEGYNPYYSSDEIGPFLNGVTSTTFETVADGADATAVDTTAGGVNTTWPVVANSFFGTIEVDDGGSYSFAYEGSGYVVRGSDKLTTSTDFTVVEAGGSITVTNATGASVDMRVSAWYKTDMEFSENIPEMKISISSIPVAVKTRKLKAMWSQESEQDLKAYHGLSADAELTALVSNEMIAEIDREIIQKCLTIAPASSRFTYDWNAFAANNTTGNFLDTHLALMQKATRASNEIFRKSKIGPANWMVMGTKVASYIEVLKGFIPNPVTASLGMNIVKAGTYAGRFDIYKDPLFPDNKILMGHKSPSSPFGAGLVYSPYVTNLTPVIVGENDFNPRRGFLARYGLTQVPHGQLLYGIITINNLP
jgi:hypothetical protein